MRLEKTLQNLRKTKEEYFNIKIYFRHSNFYVTSIFTEKGKRIYGFSDYRKKSMIIYGYDSKKPYRIECFNRFKVKYL